MLFSNFLNLFQIPVAKVFHLIIRGPNILVNHFQYITLKFHDNLAKGDIRDRYEMVVYLFLLNKVNYVRKYFNSLLILMEISDDVFA